jgi:zinc transport system ATP-binding protein
MVMAATDEVICLNHHVCCHGRPEAVSRHPEYLSLFGTAAAGALAVYTHHHDHRHDISGEPMEAPAGEDEAYDG